MMLYFLFVVLVALSTTNFVVGQAQEKAIDPKSHCTFQALGQQYEVDKVDSYHNYHTLYCEVLQPYLHLKRDVMMLEVGFGCGHIVQGRSCLLFNRFFHGKVQYHAIDYTDPPSTAINCAKGFQEKYPNQLKQIWVGDQQNFGFLSTVTADLKKANVSLDVVIDDGGHKYGQQLATFLMLWPLVAPGGVYVVEDLAADDGFTELMAIWMRKIGHIQETGRQNKLPAQLSPDILKKNNMQSVPFPQGANRLGCSWQICYIRKINTPFEDLPRHGGDPKRND